MTPVSENLRVEKLVRQDWMQGESNVMELSERGRREADVKMETEAAAAEADMEEKADRDTTKANMEEKAGSVAAKAAIEEISERGIADKMRLELPFALLMILNQKKMRW